MQILGLNWLYNGGRVLRITKKAITVKHVRGDKVRVTRIPLDRVCVSQCGV